VTLVLTISGRESIWLLADRRLSLEGRAPKDDARKVMFLDTTDGVAILGYAGLGATALGTEPADWMAAVLRGRNLPLEQSLGVLAEAMKKQFPRHMVQMQAHGGPAHTVIISAYLENQPRLYTIDLAFASDRKTYQFRYTRHMIGNSLATARTKRMGIVGTGATYLVRDKKWIRSLLHLVRASDRRQLSPRAVADHLASLNYKVSLGIADKSVGPSCIVAWRNRGEGVHKDGGAHQFYNGTNPESSSPSLPWVTIGMDLDGIVGVMMPHFAKNAEVMQAGESTEDLDEDELNEDLAQLPNTPDEDLR